MTASNAHPARWWRPVGDTGDVHCELCPRGCTIKPGKRGFCFVRQNLDGRLVSTTYGLSTGFCVDPIEKKPLHHFYPGTPVLSFGTSGCNLGCKCCQNWTSVRSRQVESASARALPDAIVAACNELRVESVAYTYNEPSIWAEYAVDTARACREVGIRNVAVTNGYIMPEARREFYQWMDAANVDLKGFTDDFYRQYTGASLEPIKETLVYLIHETSVWVEITNLLIPRANDSPSEIEAMCDWIVEALGPDVPLHFSAFHPDFQLTDRPATPHSTLISAYDTARRAGLNYVYVGNLPDPERQSTYCPLCGELLIRRSGYELPVYRLDQGHCRYCGATIAGRFAEKSGTWGSRRQPVQIAAFASEAKCQPPAARDDGPADATAQAGPVAGREESPAVEQESIDPPNAPAVASEAAPILSSEQERSVFQAAGRRVIAAVHRRSCESLDQMLPETADVPLIGAFVSLKRSGHLRSCCGTLATTIPLCEAVESAVVRTATDDPRFPPISPSELSHLDMEVWLLWGMQPMAARGGDRIAAVEIGRHGLQIARGRQRGLLLPSVAIEHKMDAHAFLQAVCRKAGLPLDAWREDDTLVQTFEGHVIRGPFATVEELADEPEGGAAHHAPSPNDLRQLARFSQQNFLAIVQGATPSYYLPGAYDGNVAGVLLRWSFTGTDETVDSTKIASRNDLPLQATLFELVKAAVAGAASRGIAPATAMSADVQLTVLTDCTLHGSARAPALEGVAPEHRLLMLSRDRRWALAFDPDRTAEALLAAALERAKLAEGEDASLLSYAVATTEDGGFVVANIPQARRASGMRRPAVAGQFYPAAPQELNRMLDEMIPEDRSPEPYHALLAPHAGWVYSGKLAAETFSRVVIPEAVLVFAPRHRRMGADWAVSPHETWQMPGGNVPSDPELAERLAHAVDGLELDAAAHAQEHAIEVQLPIISRLARSARVVGVALGRASWSDIERRAGQLAAFLSAMPRPPLLAISSDMNHFADLSHTKRVDHLALAAIESLDPKRVYETVTEHEISMCGMIPCALVLETLRRMDRLHTCEQVGYTTSAEASGDTQRVVGYAGLLFR